MAETTDAQLHLDKVLQEESTVLTELKDAEAIVRMRLAELKALQQLKKEATDKLQEATEQSYEEEVERHRKLREEEEAQNRSIDELLESTETARVQSASSNPAYQSENTQPLYNLQDTDQVAVATDSRTLDDLYSIRDKKILTNEDVQKAFDIANSVLVSNSYESSSPLVQERKEAAYQTLKTVLEARPEITDQYKSTNTDSAVSQFIESLKKSPVTEYKN